MSGYNLAQVFIIGPLLHLYMLKEAVELLNNEVRFP